MKDTIYTAEAGGCKLLESGIIDGYNYIIATMGTHPRAYVEIPEWHLFHHLRPSILERLVHCHGGLTCIEHMPPPVLDIHNTNLWIGWDYAHIGDHMEYPKLNIPGRKYSFEEIQQDVKDVISQIREYAPRTNVQQ